MPEYKPRPGAVRVTLPSNPDLWVEIRGDIRWNEYKHILTAKNVGAGEFIDEIARRLMVSWNLERDGKKLELNPDELTKDDFEHLVDKMLDVINAVAEEAHPNGLRP